MTRDQWLVDRQAIHDRLYEMLVGSAGCGPFDGGCLVVARAMQRVFGGEVIVLTRADGRADHAVLDVGGQLWDYDGPDAPADMLRRFNASEMASCVGYRPLQEGDLLEAVRDPVVEETLVGLFEEVRPFARPLP